MASISVNANLFRIVYSAVSTEETRYYLNGVSVTPHHDRGVLLVATDGHRMLVAHDETGETDGSHIVQLDKATLKACKPGKNETSRLTVEGDAATVSVASIHDAENFAPRNIAQGVLIEGTFPDWRRVMPNLDRNEFRPQAFDGVYVASMASVGAELSAHFGVGQRTMHIASSDEHAPALVQWGATPLAFGILMPMRADFEMALPGWVGAA